MISARDITTLRSIARAGGDYATIKQLLSGTSWKIDEDEVDLGFLRIFIPDAADECYRLIIGYRDPDHPPYLLLSFSVFPAAGEQLAAFNAAFQSVTATLTQSFGPPNVSGDHRLSFRTWSYAYHRWSLPEGEFTLVQAEFDIMEGLDVTLWIHPVGTPIEKALHI